MRSIEGLDILKRMFGNKQKLISAHMDELLKTPSSPDQFRQFKYVYDKINVHLGGLEASGVDLEKYCSLFLLIIMAGPPREISTENSISYIPRCLGERRCLKENLSSSRSP